MKETEINKLVSAVADGPSDALCPLKSYQLLHETQLPQSECAMLRVMMNGRTHRPSKLRAVSVWQVDAWTARRPSKVRSMILERPSVGELYRQQLATINLRWRNFLSPEFGTKSQGEVPLFLEFPEFLYSTV